MDPAAFRLIVATVAGFVLIVLGAIRGDGVMIALGGGALGIPGLTEIVKGSTPREH